MLKPKITTINFNMLRRGNQLHFNRNISKCLIHTLGSSFRCLRDEVLHPTISIKKTLSGQKRFHIVRVPDSLPTVTTISNIPQLGSMVYI